METVPSIADLFRAALARPIAERAQFLDEACAGDATLRAELDALLAADAAVDEEGFLTKPLARFAEVASYEGQLIGPYRVAECVGQGGMGRVYRAVRSDTGTEAALKFIRSDVATPARLDRFLQERRILGQLQHPGIARFLDAGATPDGTPFVVMEYVAGQPLTAYATAAHRFDVHARLRLFLDVCAAVQYAHQNLIVHRDLKPSNIQVTTDGQVKLLDFGIAKLLDDEMASWQTVTAEALLTPAYASPEQLRREAITIATDVYALGVVLFELLTGQHPFAGATESPATTVEAIIHQPAPKPSEVAHNPEAGRLRGDLDTVVLKALRKAPERRYASVEALAEDIRCHLDRLPIAARRESWTYVAQKFVQRNRMAVGASAFGLVALVIGLVVAVWQGDRAAHERDLARLEAEKSDMAAAFMVKLFRVADPTRPNAIRADTLRLPMLLDVGAEAAHERFADHPEVRARVLDSIAEMHRMVGDYPASEATYGAAAAAWLDAESRENEDYARSLKYQAFLLMMMGDLEAAEPMQREVLALRQRMLGDEAESVGSISKNLGTTMLLKGDFEAAEGFYDTALRIRKQFAATDPLGALQMQAFMGRLYFMQGRYAEADSMLSASLSGHIDGEHAVGKARILHWLGWVRRAQGQLAEAEALHLQGLALRRELFGDGHLRVAESLVAYADVLWHQERYTTAETVLRDAIAIYDRLGWDMLDVSHPHTQLARTLLALNKLDAAEVALSRARAIRTRLPPKSHWQSAEIDGLTGALLLQGGEAEPAQSLLERSITTLTATRGAEHPITVEMQAYLRMP
ncbi:MAG: serine/threonine-protein kinase [Bacteroidota bacterium]